MNNKTAKQIYTACWIKRVLLGVAYAAALALLIWLMTKNTLIGIMSIAVLASSVKAPFDKINEKDLESVIYEDLDPEKFNEILALGAFKRSTRHQVLGALSAGDHKRVLEIVEKSEKKTIHPIEQCNNLYRRGAIHFERGEFDKLPDIVRQFEELKAKNPKIAYVFNNFTVFDKFDAFADEDYEYVVDVCDVDLRENNPRKQNHKMTKVNVSFYRAVSLYKLGRYDEAREGFEELIEYAPKMYKAKLAKEYLEKL
jgi:tetratricopeptide (TPR) repeat protein